MSGVYEEHGENYLKGTETKQRANLKETKWRM